MQSILFRLGRITDLHGIPDSMETSQILRLTRNIYGHRISCSLSRKFTSCNSTRKTTYYFPSATLDLSQRFDNFFLPFSSLSSEAGQVLGLKKHEDDLAWKISVSADGTVRFNFPGSIHGQCSLTISDYPYDEQKCSFTFVSWVHDGSELALRLRPSFPLDMRNYVPNNEWHIVGTEAQHREVLYQCCSAPHYTTSFNIHVRRGASSYVSSYIIPSILIAILSIMMFTLPPEVGKRMGEYSVLTSVF